MRNWSRFSPSRSDLPPVFWFLWLGTVVNRLGGFAVPFLMLYLTGRLGLWGAMFALGLILCFGYLALSVPARRRAQRLSVRT